MCVQAHDAVSSRLAAPACIMKGCGAVFGAAPFLRPICRLLPTMRRALSLAVRCRLLHAAPPASSACVSTAVPVPRVGIATHAAIASAAYGARTLSRHAVACHLPTSAAPVCRPQPLLFASASVLLGPFPESGGFVQTDVQELTSFRSFWRRSASGGRKGRCIAIVTWGNAERRRLASSRNSKMVPKASETCQFARVALHGGGAGRRQGAAERTAAKERGGALKKRRRRSVHADV